MARFSVLSTAKLIAADIRGSRRFCLWFVINLAIGLFGFAVIDVIKEGLGDVLVSKAREINGSDLEIGGRKPIPAAMWRRLGAMLAGKGSDVEVERPQMEQYTSLYSMVSYGDADVLVRVNGIGSNYPLYGDLAVEGRGAVRGNELQAGDKTWLTAELAKRLKARTGDTITVAGQDLLVTGIISQDSTTAVFNNRLAPEMYTGRAFLSKSRLLTTGSIANYRYLFRYAEDVPADAVVAIKNTLTGMMARDGYRVVSYQDRNQPGGRLLMYTADFLSLVSLMAFFLACLGSGYLFYGYFQTKIADIGIYKSLGATNGTINIQLVGSALVLALLAAALALGIAAALTPFAIALLQKLFALGTPNLPLAATAYKLIAMAIVCALMISAPILASVRNVSPAVLLDNQLSSARSRLSKWPIILIGAMILTVIYGFALWQSESLRIGTAFFGTFIGLLIALGIIATVAVVILTRWPLPRSLNVRLALCRLRSEAVPFTICVIALGLGMTIVQAIHHIKHSVQNEMAINDKEGKLPGLFLFDIQDDQYQELRDHLSPLVDDSKTVVSPMIRGKFTYLPGRSTEDEEAEQNQGEDELNRDKQWQRRTENRGVNLSFRQGLSSSETLAEGRVPVTTYREGDVAEITVEKRYAGRLGVKVGDKLGFDISGIPIDAKVVGLRNIKWNSFQPNFFIQVQPGVLDDFPKTYVAAIAAKPTVTKEQLKETIIAKFPTVSIVDVETVITKMLDIMDKLIIMLNGTAALALIAGLVVMVSIISSKLRERQWDLNVIKILGGKRPAMYRQLLIDYGLLSLLASSTSLGLGIVMAYTLVMVMFDSTFRPDWSFALFSGLGLIALFVTIAVAMTESLIRKKPSLTISQ